jgi:hypothetical protein
MRERGIAGGRRACAIGGLRSCPALAVVLQAHTIPARVGSVNATCAVRPHRHRTTHLHNGRKHAGKNVTTGRIGSTGVQDIIDLDQFYCRCGVYR